MFKNTVNTGKKCILNAYDFKYSDISKRKKHQFPENRICFLKRVTSFFKLWTPCMKNAPDPSKSCMGSKKGNMRQGYLQAIETISKYKWRNALGFELQSAPNLHRDKKKVLNFKMHQTCTGTKKTKKSKNFRGIVAPSQVDCEVFVFFCFFLSLCRFGGLWSSKLLFFFVPVQVLCILQLKPSVCFVPVEVLYDSWLAIKMYYFAGYWNCFCWFPDSGSFSKKYYLMWEESWI